MNEDDPIYEAILNFLKDPKSDWGPIFIEHPLNRNTEIEMIYFIQETMRAN